MPPKWSFSAGNRPHTVTVYDRELGGIIYVRARDAQQAPHGGRLLMLQPTRPVPEKFQPLLDRLAKVNRGVQADTADQALLYYMATLLSELPENNDPIIAAKLCGSGLRIMQERAQALLDELEEDLSK